ncbi:hypothetical protein EGW08_006787 [Elysia chlorotica]|uniref:non-specific serine/threonine protein kinase n=1 Tax=Elysia chlorotica TaxID=188477 RepID=A0A3S1A8M7_ELYCH|nr:hypothetical protein EGW08_006787 [Elysia chlorotica]
MGNQLTGKAPAVIYPVEHYLNDIPSYDFDCGLGSTRFFKVGRARGKEGLVVVRVFVIHDPSIPLPLKENQDRLDAIFKSLKNLPNCLPFQKHVKLDRAAVLIRQYVKYSLYDRLSTRPFLTVIEKKWVAFQLLCALNQCHKVQVCHGDIKTENVLLTGWNWLLLTDFASFKPTYLPFDNPADYSYFFDTSRRRVCYIAPERFVKRPPAEVASSTESTESERLKPAMDIFSAGCVIIELFCDGVPPFDLSQLLNYSCKNYIPYKLIDTIPDNNIKDLVEHMVQRKPDLRLSAEEYLIKHRGKAFPEYFYTFFKTYSQQFATTPIMPSDDRILILNRDMDHILASLDLDTERPEKNSKLVLVISLVTSVARDLHFSSFRLIALSLLVRLAKHVTAEIILDRILPYILWFAQDPLPEVRAETIRSVTACVKNLRSVPRNDGNVFQDYIIPALVSFLLIFVTLWIGNSEIGLSKDTKNTLFVVTASLHQLKLYIYIYFIMKLFDADLDPPQVESNYDMELQQLKDLIQQKIFQLLSDPNHAVKMTLMANGMDKLCLFFGRQKANDILLSHIVTFLNVKDDWRLRACFFKTVVDVTMYVGWQCSEVLLPLLQQGLSDTEEFVISEDLHALKQLTNHRLLTKTMMQTLVCDAAALLAHPGPWVRQAAVGFVTAVAQAYDIPDIHCKLLPQVRPFLSRNIMQLRKPAVVLDGLAEPIPRDVFDYLLRSPQLDTVFDVLAKQIYIRSISRQPRSAYPEVDDNVAQVFRKLTSLGLTEEFERKLLVRVTLKSYKLALLTSFFKASKSERPQFASQLNSLENIGGVKLSPNYFNFYREDETRTLKRLTQVTTHHVYQLNFCAPQNPEWKKMFGSEEPDTSSMSTSPSVSSVTDGRQHLETSVRTGTSTASTSPVITRYAKCKWELRDLVHHKRAQFERDLMTTVEIGWGAAEASSGGSHAPADSWRPKGVLVAHLQEHRGAINRLGFELYKLQHIGLTIHTSMHLLYAGGGKVNQIQHCLSYIFTPGGKIKCVTFLERLNSLASVSDNNSIHIYRLDSGSVQLEDSRIVDMDQYGQVMDMTHFDTGGQSMLTYATVSGHIVGWDQRCQAPAWTLTNNPRYGLITALAVNPSHCWLAAGTYSGQLVCWDLRFHMAINKIQHASGRRVKRLAMHPSEQSWLVASFNWNNEVSMWDAETGQRQKTLWPSATPPLSYNKQNQVKEEEGMGGLYIGSTENKTFLLTGGTDMRLRFWDLNYPANSHCFNHGLDDPRSMSLTYRSQLMEGSEVIQELETQRDPVGDRSDRENHLLHSSPLQGHQDIVNDLTLCHSSQSLVISAGRNGHIKVWK